MTFTAPITPGLGAEPLSSPAPAQAPFSLLSVIQPLPLPGEYNPGDDGLPTSAVRLSHQRCVQAATAQNCPDGEQDPFPYQELDTGYPFYPVSWVVGVGCAEAPAGSDTFTTWNRWATEDVAAVSANAMESFLWSKASLASVQGPGTFMPSLGAVATVVPTEDDQAVNPRDGIAQLIRSYNDCNQAPGQAIVHIPDVLGPYLMDRKTIAPDATGTVLRTATGVRAVLGTGYDPLIGPFANAGGDPTPDDEGTVWIYITGQIFANLGSPRNTADPTGAIRASGRIPDGFANPRLGEQGVWVMRRGLFAFDTCCVLAIQVRDVNVTGEIG